MTTEELRNLLMAEARVAFPESATSEERTIPAFLIAEAISAGRAIHVANAIISGTLRMPYTKVSKELVITRTRFDGYCDFRHCSFDQHLVFHELTFTGSAQFSNAIFKCGFSFREVTFEGGHFDFSYAHAQGFFLASDNVFKGAYFNGAQFDQGLDLASSRFVDIADFKNIRVALYLNCSGAIFEKRVDFSGSRIGSNAYFNVDDRPLTNGVFRPTQFKDEAIFQAMTIGRQADFSEAKFTVSTFHRLEVGGPLYCLDAEFCGPTSFLEVHVKGSAFFDGSHFHDRVDFDGSHIDGGLTFRAAPDASITTFVMEATFEDVTVKGTTDLRGVIFEDPVSFVRCRFGNNLICGSDTQPAQFHSTVDFTDAVVEANANFIGVTFTHSALFNDFNCNKSADFSSATFESYADFQACHIAGDLTFNKVVIYNPADKERGADFVGLKADGDASFQDCVFTSPISFQDAQFSGTAFFDRSRFEVNSTPHFVGANFKWGVHFETVRFESRVEFRSARFAIEARFSGSTFTREVNFEGALFYGRADFGIRLDSYVGACVFRGKTHFSHAVFNQDASFIGTTFEKAVSFREATFTVLMFSEPSKTVQQFLEKVDFRGCTFNRLNGDPLALLKKQQPYDRQTFSRFEKALRTNGDDELADDVYLERRGQERKGRRRLHYLLDVGYGFIANYGVRPYRLIILASLLMCWTAFIFAFPGSVRLKPLPPGTEATRHIEPIMMLNFPDCVRFTVKSFLPIELPLASHLEATDKRLYGLRSSDWATIIKIAGWVMVPFGIAVLTGILRRVSRT
jgi:uncharacterized protein YjbI with pentapeptide repeats